MNLYVNAVNTLIAHEEDRATVGFVLCADRNEAVAHLSLQGIAAPIAVTLRRAPTRVFELPRRIVSRPTSRFAGGADPSAALRGIVAAYGRLDAL
jgi:hypothetical protein